ncbi:MAG: Holliday junction branch migration protein RuvA [Candidatus Omnitrophota bacterium]|nr:Holliday junction branch migration protein RuvA [Candidatus Omnitrophota bacterium]
MIVELCGKLKNRGKNCVVLDVQGISYEVLMPATVFERLNENINNDGILRLITYHYLQAEPSRSTPVLIGFLNQVEKDFFEQFITVSGIGPRAAVRALNKPISDIARAIDEGDLKFLKTLPGIGEQRAKEIVAKLQKKVGKFGLIQDSLGQKVSGATQDWQEEALEILLQLQYKKQEAKEMIQKALERHPEIANSEELLNEIYRQKVKR